MRQKKQGYKALAAVPLTLNNQVVGIFSIYSELPDAFDDKMLALLELLGRDISAALKRLKERQKQEFAERKIQHLSQVVKARLAYSILKSVSVIKIACEFCSTTCDKKLSIKLPLFYAANMQKMKLTEKLVVSYELGDAGVAKYVISVKTVACTGLCKPLHRSKIMRER